MQYIPGGTARATEGADDSVRRAASRMAHHWCRLFYSERTEYLLVSDYYSKFRLSGACPRNVPAPPSFSSLRGAWRDHCFPEPFSLFLHETGLESLKITSACCFLLKCQRKDSKKAKEHRQFRGVLGRWRTAAIDRTIFHACQRCRKTAVFAVFCSALGCHLPRKSLS